MKNRARLFRPVGCRGMNVQIARHLSTYWVTIFVGVIHVDLGPSACSSIKVISRNQSQGGSHNADAIIYLAQVVLSHPVRRRHYVVSALPPTPTSSVPTGPPIQSLMIVAVGYIVVELSIKEVRPQTRPSILATLVGLSHLCHYTVLCSSH